MYKVLPFVKSWIKNTKAYRKEEEIIPATKQDKVISG